MARLYRGDRARPLWLMLVVAPCLLRSGLNAMSIGSDDTLHNTSVASMIDSVTADTTLDTADTTLDTANDDSTNSTTCGSLEFRCDDGECIGKGLVCDAENHCPDGSDENEKMCKRHAGTRTADREGRGGTTDAYDWSRIGSARAEENDGGYSIRSLGGRNSDARGSGGPGRAPSSSSSGAGAPGSSGCRTTRTIAAYYAKIKSSLDSYVNELTSLMNKIPLSVVPTP